MNSSKNNCPPRFIYFTGIDGSGKSTFVDMLVEDFKSHGLPVKKQWLRFNYFFTKPLLLYCRIVGLTRRPKLGDRKISVHDFYKSPRIGKAIQYLHLLDTCIHYLFRVYIPQKISGTYILCDRFVYDILADFMIENRDFDLPEKPMARYLLRLLPNDNKVFYISVSKEEVLRRKPTVIYDDEDFDLKFHVYDKIRDCFEFDVIDNHKRIEDVYPVIKKKLKMDNLNEA